MNLYVFFNVFFLIHSTFEVSSSWIGARKSVLRKQENFDIGSEVYQRRARALRTLQSFRGGASKTNDEDEKPKGVCIGIDLGTTYRSVKFPYRF